MPPSDGGIARRDDGFFLERAEFFESLDHLLAGETKEAQAPHIKKLCEIIDKYQEQSHLLDPYLGATVAPVMQRVRDRLRAWHASRRAAVARAASSTHVRLEDGALHALFQLIYQLCKTRGYKHIIRLFPHEVADLEPAASALMAQDTADHETWPSRYSLLLWLSILVLIPFDLSTVDSTVVGAGAWVAGTGHGIVAQKAAGAGAGAGTLITSIIVACQGFLSDPGAPREAAAVCLARLLTRPDMDSGRLRLFTGWAVEQLGACAGDSGSETAGAAAAAAATADGGGDGGGGGGEGGAGVGDEGGGGGGGGGGDGDGAGGGGAESASSFPSPPRPAVALASRMFLATGVLQALVEIAKHGHRDTLRDVLADVFSRVLALLGSAVGAGGATGTSAGRSAGLRASPLLRKFTIKLAARTGLTYLPPRVAAWRYSRGARSLLDNLSVAGVAAAKTKVAEQAAAAATAAAAVAAGDKADGLGNGAAGAGGAAALLKTGNDALLDGTTLNAASGSSGSDAGRDAAAVAAAVEEEDGEIPPETEDIIDLLLQGLRDTDTVVRWSAAKGVGRLTGRLPLAFADDVVAAVLQLLVPRESDAAWHGGCLALAELARRGLLLPTRLPAVVPLVLAALSYDVRRGAHSVGAHVRDAACYVCWAFARAYAPGVMRPHILPLARGMLITALFDREVNCRRAASAAFQENVGRQGHEAFPSGIAILTAADYFTLGNRANAFLGVAPVVAAFPAYAAALQEHVLTVKLRHWDRDVRELSARSAAALAQRDPSWALQTALPALLPLVVSTDVFIRHGAVLGIAEIVLSLSRVCASLPAALQDEVRNVVVVAEKARAYTGRGGEMVRVAMARLIECQCLAGHAISRKAALRLLSTLDDCLKHPIDTVQAAATAALRALAAHALADPETAVLDRLPRTLITRLADENPAVRRGASLALGALPRSLLSPPGVADAVLKALLKAAQPERQAYKRDAETRRNAAMALGDVVVTLGFGRRRILRVGADGARVTAATAAGEDVSPASAAAAPAVPTAAAATSAAAAASFPGVTAEQLASVWEGLLYSTRDYAVDNRGDVGSWVRKAALESMERILVALQAARFASERAEALLTEASTSAAPSAALEGLLALSALDPLALAGDLASRLETAQCTSGYGTITGYGAGTRLITAAALAASGSPAVQEALRAPPARGVTVNGLRLLQAVESLPPSAFGEAPPLAFAGYIAVISGAGYACTVQPFAAGSAPVQVQAKDLCAATSATLAANVAATASAAAVAARAGSAPIALPAEPAALAADAMFPDALVLLGMGTLLRQGSEKLDLLRAVAGDGMCRLLHLPGGLPPLAGVPHRPELEAAFPPVAGWSGGGGGGAASVVGDEFGPEDADNSGAEGSAAAASEAEEGEGGVGGTPAPAALASAGGGASTVQWAIPHQCFPRIAPLLGCGAYVPYLLEGLVTAVGGLSESVVKHSAAALRVWALDARRTGATQQLAAVADGLTALLQPRPRLPWDVAADGKGAEDGPGADVAAVGGGGGGPTVTSAAAAAGAHGFDPSLARWFKEILGTDAGSGGGAKKKSESGSTSGLAATHRVDVRLVVPSLRSLELLLGCGALDCLRPPASSWGAATVVIVRRRVFASKEDVPRVLAAADVFLGFLGFGEVPAEGAAEGANKGPTGVVPAALISLLDLLGHPFPRVRKAVAEHMYVRLLVLGDTTLAATEAGLDGVLSALTETTWDAELHHAIAARDAMYPAFGLTPPAARMGTSADDRALATGASAGGGMGGAASGEGGYDFSSYGALAREAGF